MGPTGIKKSKVPYSQEGVRRSRTVRRRAGLPEKRPEAPAKAGVRRLKRRRRQLFGEKRGPPENAPSAREAGEAPHSVPTGIF